MRDAVNELTRCRVTLKWTYAMAYFLAAGNKKQIFEDIQAYVPCECPLVRRRILTYTQRPREGCGGIVSAA